MKLKNKYTDTLAFIVKLILGVTFIYASYHKIEDPGAFAKILYGYGVFPDTGINILAITIPFIELTAGFSLILGWYPRSAVMIINVLLFLFVVVIGFNLIRGHQFDCGCFTVSIQDQKISNIFVLIRDILFLGGGVFLFKKIKAS